MTTENATGAAFRVFDTVVSRIVTPLIAGSILWGAHSIAELNSAIIEMQAWRSFLATTTTVPRGEIDLREQIIKARLDQMDLRIQSIQGGAESRRPQ